MTNLGPLHMCDVVMLGLLVGLIIVGVGVVSNALTIFGGPVFMLGCLGQTIQEEVLNHTTT